MKKYSLLALLLGGFISAGVEANEPIADRDVFEAKYIKCIEANLVEGCLQETFIGHFARWYQKPEKVLASTESFYAKWIAGSTVYKVHTASKVIKASVFDNRSYLIERSDGELSGFFIGFRNIHGEWYVYDIQGGSDDAFIRRMLDIPRIGS